MQSQHLASRVAAIGNRHRARELRKETQALEGVVQGLEQSAIFLRT